MKVTNPTCSINVLPNEIILVILDSLDNHKPTLAKCMRVSLRMYQLVAPRLYTYVDWSGPQSFPFFLPPASSLLLNRVSPPKSDLFHLIRSFDLIAHARYRCCPLRFYSDEKNRLESLLNVPLLKYNTFGKAISQTYPNHIDTPSSRCPILAKIAPTRLVVHASYTELLPIRYIDRRNLNKIVAFLGLIPLPLQMAE